MSDAPIDRAAARAGAIDALRALMHQTDESASGPLRTALVTACAADALADCAAGAIARRMVQALEAGDDAQIEQLERQAKDYLATIDEGWSTQAAVLAVAVFCDDEHVREVARLLAFWNPWSAAAKAEDFGRYVVAQLSGAERDQALLVITDEHPQWGERLTRAARQIANRRASR